MVDAIMILIIGGFFQGILLVAGLLFSPRSNVLANRILALFIGLISITLLARTQYDQQWIQSLMTNWGWLIDSLILFYSPLLYLYLKVLFGLNTSGWWRHFVSWILFPGVVLLHNTYWQGTEWDKPIALAVGVWITVHLFYYHIRSFSLLSGQGNLKSKTLKEKVRFYKIILTVIAISFAVLVFNGLTQILEWSSPLLILDYDLLWVLISLISLAFGYKAVAKPGFYSFRNHTTSTVDAELKQQLLKTMETDKPFLDPLFDLQALADSLGVKKQMISDVIQNGVGANFYDFINGYRVEEFITLANDQKHAHLKYLAIAYKAGFNSKTTFYKAFKNATNQTPSEYFKVHKENSTKMFA